MQFSPLSLTLAASTYHTSRDIMPRWSIPEALYDVMIEYPDFFKLPGVQQLTGLQSVPWDEDNPIALWAEEDLLPAILSFNRYYSNLKGSTSRLQALSTRSKNNKEQGRDSVMEYMRAMALRWRLRQKILASISSRGMSAYAVLRAGKTQKVSVRSCHKAWRGGC